MYIFIYNIGKILIIFDRKVGCINIIFFELIVFAYPAKASPGFLFFAVYYIMSVTIAVNAVVSFIAGIANIAGGMVLTGIGQIIFCIPLAIVYFVLLRLGCEVVNAILEHCGKE